MYIFATTNKQNMIHTETRFAYRHKPTGKWVALESFNNNSDVYMRLVDRFLPKEMAYYHKNVLKEDLMRSYMKKEYYAAENILEFELVKIEVEYRIKQ